MGSYVFDPNTRSHYVLVQMSSETKTYWSGTDFVEDLKQAEKYSTYAEAATVLWHEIDEKYVKGRIVPIPLSALMSSESH